MPPPFPDIEVVSRDLTRPQDAASWLHREREALLARTGNSGALLLRGLPIASAQDFHECVEALDLGRFRYRESLSNAVRVDRTDLVFTANEAPPEATIRLHHELAQTPAHPRHLLFFCEAAAEEGGATALCRSDQLHDEIKRDHPEFLAVAASEGVVYRHVMPADDDPDSSMGRSWRSTLNADTRVAAENKLAGLGYTSAWLPEDELEVTTPTLPAVLALPDGRRTFFNQIVATRSWKDTRNDPSRAVRLGGGGEIPISLRDDLAERTDALAVDLDWQNGDVAIIDNHLVQHGRRPFVGKRSVLVAFGARA